MTTNRSPAPGANPPKAIWITGAAGGIGRAVVARLAATGARIHATDLDVSTARDLPAEWEPLDATDEAAVDEFARTLRERYGALAAVVHLVGRVGAGPLHETSLADWRALLDVNLTSAFLVARAARPLLRAGRGTLLLTASTNALDGGSALSGAAYAVAKAGVVNLTRYLAKEWAGDGIRVNCLAPGPVATPMLERLGPDGIAALARSSPLGRVAEAADVAALVEFLCSSGAAYLTGTVHNVSGGRLLD